ncbi:acyl carrier protein [Nocardia sp. XZ_19_385]|uniref:acyl carrier protein n=1 Tax=Nocardia sp. XZ_19_385 TaxID=2769488 RepID=UPI001890ADA5|nr:acyl carrier protein [Nocardia sp. XZ_19_385]
MMNESAVLAVVCRRLGEVLRIDAEEIPPDILLIALPGADSLRLVEVIVRVEDELGIALLDQEKSLLEVRTVADLARLAAGANP